MTKSDATAQEKDREKDREKRVDAERPKIHKSHSHLHRLPSLLHADSFTTSLSNHQGWHIHFHHEESDDEDDHHHHRNWSIHDIALTERVRHFTWSWYTMTMATGGLANVLYSIPEPYRFPGLYAIGCTFFLFNIFLFLFNTVVISIRFYLWPATFKESFLHPTESLFIPAVIISIGTVLVNIAQYGVGAETGHWLDYTMVVLFWIYCGMSVLLSSGIYLIMWSTQTFTIAQMTPVWIFPAYPVLLAGPLAAQLAKKLDNAESAITIVFGGFILQGIGFMVSVMIYSAYMYRLMTQKLPTEALRPGMFISIGPSGFTVSGLIGMSQQLPRLVGPDFMGPGMGDFAAKVSIVIATWCGVWLWGLAIWFFFVSVGAHFSCIAQGRMHFAMNWYSFVFPNTALTTATFAVSIALGHNSSFAIIGCILTVALVITWCFVFGNMIRAVYLKHILWPQMQEDRDEGGWGKSGKKKKLKASIVPPGAVPTSKAAIQPIAIEGIDPSGVPVVMAVGNEKEPSIVPG